MKKRNFMKKALSALLSLVMLVTVMPKSITTASANSSFTQQNVLQVNANSSSDYISGSWYSLTNGSGNLRDAGCGIVSLVSAVYNLGGTIEKSNIGSVIDEVFDWAYSKGYWTGSAGTYWSMFVNSDDKFGAKYGFSVSKQYGSKDSESTSLTSLVNHIKNGDGTAVVHVYGHFMVVVDYKTESGKEMLRVFDPAPGAGSNYNSLKRRNVTHAAGDWFELSVLQRDGGTKGNQGSTENIEIDGYWLISPTGTGSTSIPNSTNPDSYPVCERDLVYNSTVETGNDVKWVQCILKHLGYSIDIDGSYGPSSRDTIKKFQSAYGLTVDGQTGPKTRAKLKEVWASNGHAWNGGTVVTAATHTSTGVKTYKCNYCEATKNETTAKLTGHTYSSWQNHDTTYHKKTCDCGDVQYANHTWNSGTVTSQSTCTATGIRTYTCTGCNATKNESISAKGHSYDSWQNHDTTYHKKTCSCGDVQYANHTWNSGVITKDATHTETGIKTYTCTGCNTSKTETIAKLSGHVYGAWQNHNATQHKKICACGDVQYASHTWNSGTITKAATHTEEGIKTYICTGCNAMKTETIAKLIDHAYGGWVNYDETQHKRVCDCGKYELAMHDWDAGNITTPASNVTEGVKTYTCLSCNATKTEKMPVLVDNHEWDEGAITKYPVCVGEGIKTYTCIKCGETKEVIVNFITHDYGGWNSCNDAQHRRVCACGEIEEVAEHAWDTSFVSKKPTYTENGEKTYYCTTCGAKRTEQIPMLESSENFPQIIVSSRRTIAGGTAVVTIAIKNNPGISSLILKVEYDDSLLTLTNVQYNNAMGGQTLAPADLKNPTLYWIDAFNNMNEDVVFATLTFNVEENIPVGTSTEVVVSYDANDIYNFDEENVEFSVQNGNVTLFDYIPGDINGDSVIDNRDVATLMRFFADWDIEVNEAALDVNGDDVLSNKDVTRLIQFVGGWNVEIF